MTRAKLFITALFFFFLCSKPAFPFDGPLGYKNQFPLFRPLNTPELLSAVPESSFSASLSYSSVYLVRSSREWNFGLDMEAAELDIDLKKNFRDSFELGVSLPFLSFNSGFMDRFLNDYHRAFGFPDYGRSYRPDNEFLYAIKRNGADVVKGKGGGVGVGDLRVTAKKTILTGDPAISIAAFVEAPTGDAKKGYGNGSWDTGASLLVDKNIGERVRVYLNLGFISPGDLRAYQRVRLRDYLFGGAAIEGRVLERLSVVGQVYIEGSPYPGTDISSVDRTAVLLAIGARYHLDDTSYELSFTEDPSTSGAPDFSLTFSLKKRF